MRRRILFVIGGTLLVMLIIMIVATSAVLRHSYGNLEKRSMERDVQLVRGAIAAQIDELGATVKDYAASSDIYEFVKPPTSAFVKGTLSESAAVSLHVDVRLVIDANGRIVYLGSTDHGELRLGDGLARWTEAHRSFVSFT